jgi:hypothetical protein
MDYRIISADGHIDMTWMPGDLWVANAPAKWRDQVPQVRQTQQGPRWYAEEKELGVFGGLGFGFNPVERGHSKHVDKMFDVGFYEGGPHPTTPELRLKDQQLDGVDAEVMYGILGIRMRLQQPELTQLVMKSTTIGQPGFAIPTRGALSALPAFPITIRRRRQKNCSGRPHWVSREPISPPPRQSTRCGAALGTLCGRRRKIATCRSHFTPPAFRCASLQTRRWREIISCRLLRRITMFQIGAAEFLASIVFSGALDRFPGFKFVLGEAGVSWLPYILDRMDEEYEDRFYSLNLSMKPSELWRRQGYSTYQHEASVAKVIPLIGEDNIMWGSDYPHPDGIWPDSQKWIEQDLAGLSASVRRKILCENAGKLYGLL